ncbi:hypothetical protein TPL01_31010 [Sulfuriferula plumbiphila]|uniref:DUF3579 domain-containing protein n=1 Tax=Sulfuriferula plumbiphila TaxID=171865 RepID=A0A512LBU6_9PROT|nr:DUF3579 domain-containing protein [Sulfuriferula plumbiphila]BBP04122.1 hypothetical protein SFPGR_15440 [Sulfuriferula plumbiphila]GEP31963.1 hypothetical protein TPL01_31010 [Sulfuriferula plumbiphila]
MSEPSNNELIIQGLTTSGRAFRPSDWAERLSSVLSTFGEDHRMTYSPYVRPMTLDGVKCVVVDKQLQHEQPAAFSFLMSFARENDLKVLDPAQTDSQP